MKLINNTHIPVLLPTPQERERERLCCCCCMQAINTSANAKEEKELN
jgi:hypothetical protein